jgi:hypothetical protein
VYNDDSLTDIFLRIQNRELELMISSINKIKDGFIGKQQLDEGNYFKPMNLEEDKKTIKLFKKYKNKYDEL